MRATRVLVGFVAIAGCISAARPPVSVRFPVPPSVRDSLIHAIRTTVQGVPLPDSASVRIESERSTLIPRLVYYWGEYARPQTSHGVFVQVAAVRSGPPVVLRTDGDWLLVTGGFQPATAGAALQGCNEVVYTLRRTTFPHVRPHVFSADTSLASLELTVPDTSYLREKLTPPSIKHDSLHGWAVRYWAIELRDVRQYTCTFSSDEIRTEVTDSLPGYGYIGA
jgi:hypothetical protein